MNKEIIVRPYTPADYQEVIALYKQSELYGGIFDENRDSEERLKRRIEADPNAIMVAEKGHTILGTVSLIEDGRVAWLYRFCVLPIGKLKQQKEVTRSLYETAAHALRTKGHNQVLVYTSKDPGLHKRYLDLGFVKGGDYSSFWKDI